MVAKGKEVPACKLSTIINRQFVAVQLIGRGGYGVVYEVIRITRPTDHFACKAELAATHNNLKTEWDLMSLLKENKAKHSIQGIELGAERNFNYIVMHLVGPSLSDLRKTVPNKKFTLFTTTVCAIQCFDAIVEVQKLGFIHRDVKPSNFAVGILGTEEEKLVHVLDFGLCRNLFKNKELRKPRMKAPMRGTVPYMSLNVHRRIEAGRHDDFWSFLYVLIEFHLGDLPWEGLGKEEAASRKEKRIDLVLKKCPSEFRMMSCYLQTLTYSKEPDYPLLRQILCQLMYKNKFTAEMALDWQIGGKWEHIFKGRAKFIMHKGNKNKVCLSELLHLPPAPSELLTEKDFPKNTEDPPEREQSVSKSDDTIVEKDGPVPRVRPPSKFPIIPASSDRKKARHSAETHRARSSAEKHKVPSRMSSASPMESPAVSPPKIESTDNVMRAKHRGSTERVIENKADNC